MPNRPPEASKLPFMSPLYRAVAIAIGKALCAQYPPPDQLSHELRRLVQRIPYPNGRHVVDRPRRRSHEMWLTDDEPRRIAEISVCFLCR
jgi:hypothetical protein